MKAVRILLALVGVVAAIAAIGVVTLRSDWFREQVRRRIVQELERASGTKVDIGAFRFAWDSLTAEIDNLTIHGTEQGMKPEQAPLLHIKHAAIGLEILSLAQRSFRIARIDVDTPRGHLMVHADGTTNIRPIPPTDMTVVDFKIGRFTVTNGVLITEAEGKAPTQTRWNLRGENFAAVLRFQAAEKRYRGDASVSPVHLEVGGLQPVDLAIQAAVNVEANRVTIPKAVMKTGYSELELTNFALDNFSSPVLTAAYRGRVAMQEIDHIFQLVNFRHTGNVEVKGSARFVSPRDYSISGNAEGSKLGYGAIQNISASAAFSADPKLVRLEGIRIAAAGASLRANGEVHDLEKVTLSGDINGLTTEALERLAGIGTLPWKGVLSGPFHASGNLSEKNLHSLVADAKIGITTAANGTPIHGEIDARFDGAKAKVSLDPSWLELPGTRADFSGVPNERIELKARTRDVNELRPILAVPAALRRAAGSFEGTLLGPMSNPRIAGHVALDSVVIATALNGVKVDERIDSATGDFTAADSGLTIDRSSLQWNGLHADVKGSLGLHGWSADDASPVHAEFQVANADTGQLLALAGRGDVPVTGKLATKGKLGGTLGSPQFRGDFALSKGQLAGEPFDSITGQSRFDSAGGSEVTALVIAGGKKLNVTAALDKSRVRFSATGNAIPLDQIALLREQIPEIRGTARMRVDGAVAISADGKQMALEEIGGDIAASGLALGTRIFGEARLAGVTRGGVFTGQFTSNAASASIRADGTVGLAGDYPVAAKVSVVGLRIANLQGMLNPGELTESEAAIDGTVEGRATISGPARTPEKLAAAIEVDRVDLHPASAKAQESVHNFALANDGPVRMEMANGVVRVQAAHFRGPETDVEATGQIALREKAPFDLNLRGTLNATLATVWEPDLTATGAIRINATLRGTYDKPEFDGRAELQNGEFRQAGFTNGLTNVRGAVVFRGMRATIESLTGETGGGTVQLAGFSTINEGGFAFQVEAKARGVRVRYPEGVSSVSDADLVFAGTQTRSEASGKVTVRRVAINPKSDAASILATASSPIRTVAANTGFAANINLDIEVDTAVDVVFETNVAQGVQADASLRLRGTVASPALLGRVDVTHGDMVFFGNKYSIAQGSLTFSDPARIAPVLNVDLETKARGVTVTLTISGPVNKLNVTYRSDPPMQFADIVALLATGRSPTSATLATNTTGQSPNFQQLNGSALLGQALASPAADRLQRFFGVSRIKIDPQLTGVTGTPEARLTIEQEVTPQLLFTYVSDVSNTSTQLIRVEWGFSKAWGAILTRDENGYVSLDFAYRKQFK